MTRTATFQDLVDAVLALPARDGRRLIAVAGPPASGKSTVAERLGQAVHDAGLRVVVVPMDGFHLDNSELVKMGLLDRKGAPETFDLAGFTALAKRLKQPGDVPFPTFDRSLDRVVPDADRVPAECGTVILEGNYLMFGDPGWCDLRTLWDLSIWVDVPMDQLRTRLIERWRAHGLDEDAALRRAEGNDLPNAQRVVAGRLMADLALPNGT